MRKTLGIVAGATASVTLLAFAVDLMIHDVSLNIATWACWLALDVVITTSLIKAKSNDIWLFLGYTIGAFLITVTLLFKGTWQWGMMESIVAALCAISIAAQLMSGPRLAIIFSMVTMVIGGIPTIIEAMFTPDRSTWWFWGSCAACGILSMAVAKRWTTEERFVPSISAALNGIMFILVVM